MFAIGALVLLNNVNTKAALGALNELSERYNTEVDDKHHLRGPDVGHSMAVLYDALSAGGQADGNSFVAEIKSWASGSPFNLLDVGARGKGSDALDVACMLWCRDIDKRGKSYFDEAEIAKAKQFINETLNGAEQRAELEKGRQKGGGKANVMGGGAAEEKQDEKPVQSGGS